MWPCQLSAQGAPGGIVGGDARGFKDGVDSGGGEVGEGEDAVDQHGSDVKGLRERGKARHRRTELVAPHAHHDNVPLLFRPPDAREAPAMGLRGEVLAEPGG